MLYRISQTPPEVPPERTEEEELWHTWSGLLRNWEESVKKNMKLIKQLARQGIPDPLRGMAWQLIANSQDASLKEQYPSLITVCVCVCRGGGGGGKKKGCFVYKLLSGFPHS